MSADTNANTEVPQPLGFVANDGRTSHPTKATEALSLAWQRAETRANSLQLNNDQLRDEIRELDKKREGLQEKVRSLEQRNRLKAAIVSLCIGATGILSGLAISMAKSGESLGGTLGVIVGLMVVFMLAGLVLMCWPNRA